MAAAREGWPARGRPFLMRAWLRCEAPSRPLVVSPFRAAFNTAQKLCILAAWKCHSGAQHKPLVSRIGEATMHVTPEELQAGRLTDESLTLAVRTLRDTGLVVLDDVYDPA